MKISNDFSSIFNQLEDPRSQINQLHRFDELLVMGIICVICAADTWKDMESYCIAKEDFLRTFLELPNGTPSDDTFNRVFSAIDSEEFEKCFIQWVSSIVDLTNGDIVPIDGKTIRGAKSGGKKSPVHMVSAWASENNLVLGQVKVSEKSNEITAIPKLLDMLMIKGCIVTIDAMGCQKNIAKKIIDSQAQYILAVKENQPRLHENIVDEFRFNENTECYEHLDFGHGRIETRICSVISDFQFIENNNQWEELKSIVKIESIREFKNSSKPKQTAIRYYISSLTVSSKDFLFAIRTHWHIENKLHWVLDVGFGEDASRKRSGNAAQNFSILNKIALNIVKKEKTAKQGVKGKRLKAAYDNNYLLKLLNIKV